MLRGNEGRDRRPKVTGLSPKEGIPGTKIIIRGENLGDNPDDLIGLTICGVDCLIFAEWKTPNKILTRSGRCEGLGDVIVTTYLGGIGTCTVQFKGLPDIISPTKDCSVWINEEEYFSLGKVGHGIGGSSSPVFYSYDLLNLIPDTDSEKGKSAIADNVVREFFPEALSHDKSDRGFGNPFSPDFLPAWYLLENYSNVSFDDLIRGLNNLKTKMNQKTNDSSLGPKALLKPNVLPIVDCLDALKSVQLNLKAQKSHGSDLPQKIEDLIKKALAESHSIFDSVLTRKDCADSTRNALNVLQRYRFLFNLPAAIEQYIAKNEYDLLINDYNRAKSRFADTQVSVFREVYLEVEQRIAKFRESLKEKLRKQCSNHEDRNIDEVKKLIQYLISLEVAGNPAWESLVTIKDNLLVEMMKCHDKYVDLAKNPQSVIKEPAKFFNGDDCDTPSQGPPIVQFLEDLTIIFNQSFKDLVKLGGCYLNEDFNIRDKDLETKEQIFYSDMVQKPLKSLVALIRNALLPNTVSNLKLNSWPASSNKDGNFFLWLPRCLKICCNFYQDILNEDIPQNAIQPVQQMITDLRIHSLVSLFNQAAGEVKALADKETWKVVSDDCLGTRTALPLLFESKVVEVLLLVREHIIQTTCPDEVDIFTKINVQGQMKQLAQNLLQSFQVALSEIRRELDSISISSPGHASELDGEDKILALICNCSFTSNQVLPRLHENFEKYNYPDMSMVMKVVQNKYRDLESKLFKDFVETKCDSVINSVKPSMYTVANEWYKGSVRPTDVSYYVKEIILTIVEVQGKIFLIAPSLVRKVVTQVIEATLEEIANLYQSVSDRLTEAGNIHASVDLSALEHVFADSDNFESPKAEKLLNIARSRLRPIANPQDQKLATRILSRFKTSMRLQLLCFKWAGDGNAVIAI